MIVHGEQSHPGYQLVHRRWSRMTYQDPVTQKWYPSWKQLSQDLNKQNRDQGEFFLKYGERYLSDMWEKNKDPVLGNSHNEPVCKQCGTQTKWDHKRNYFSAFCGSACSTNWYALNTDRPQRAMITLDARRKADPTYHMIPLQEKYWVSKGFTPTEAKRKIRERQQTFRLDKLIEKHGEQEGRRIWEDRQSRWMVSFMKSRDINDSHTISMVSRQMFDKLKEMFPTILYGKNEQRIKALGKTHRVDCWHPETQKIVEFYGDYYHANPELYEDDVVNKITGRKAGEQWEHDRLRRERILTNKNVVDILVVWEREWRRDPDEVIKRCCRFLQS